MAQSTKPHQDADKNKMQESSNGFLFPPTALAIVWGKDDRYWRTYEASHNNSLYKPEERTIAELLQVCWIEVTGSTDKIKAGKRYEINFRVSLKQDAFGWETPVFLMAKVGKKGKYSWTKMSLRNKPAGSPFTIPENDKLIVSVPSNISAEDKKLQFGLYEIWSGKWKGGLQIHNASVTELGN